MIGQTISQYTILEKIGEGGMGVVYKAQDVKLNRVVALKFMPAATQVNEEDRQRFLQEAQSAALLNHPNVCTIHDIKDEGGQHFIVMEYVDGQTLRKKIYGSTGQRMDEKSAVGYAVAIGEALAEAHKNGIVHRDIKADNIMINARGQIKVMDFGLAKLKGSMKLTRAASTIGTLAYMAPEQVRGDEVDARSDIFSYGVLLFEMLTGRMPFRGEHDAAMMYSIMNEQPDPVSKFNPELSPELERVIERALEKDPDDRFQHIDDLVSELRRLSKKSSRITRPMSGEMGSAAPASAEPAAAAPRAPQPGAVKGRFPFMAAGIILSIAVLAAGYFLFFNSDRSKIDSLAVLPFVNVSGNEEMEYLTEGVTDYLTNKLSQVPGLRVLPASFVAKYRNATVTPQTIGNELNVGAILTGRVVERNGKLSVQAELIDVAGVSQLWGERYDRDLGGIQELQAEIVGKVSQKLGIRMGTVASAGLVRGSTKNTEAYQAYLKGRYQWNKRSAEGIRSGLGYFQRAVDLDPSFALAWVGLAESYIFPESEDSPGNIRLPKVKAAAEKALAIDDQLAEAHAIMALYYYYHEHDAGMADKEHRKAVELDPKYPTGLHWYAEFLCFTGRFDEGLKWYRKAVEADPLSLAIATDFGYGYYIAREYDSAAAYLENILRTDPEYVRTRSYLFNVYVSAGKPEKAYNILREQEVKAGEGGERLRSLDELWNKDRLRGLGRYFVEKWNREFGQDNPQTMYLAEAYILMGMKDSAMYWIRRSIVERDPFVTGIGIVPLYDPLRDEPGFRELIGELGYGEIEKLGLARKAR